MIKKLLLIIGFLFGLSLTAQVIEKSDIYGVWKAQEIINESTDSNMKPIIDGFKNATFYFDENKNFRLETSVNSELFKMFTSMIKGTKWILDQSKPYIMIGNKEDGYTIMGIIFKKSGENTHFIIDESDINIRVQKIK